ncbi:MAG: hypothetical protein V3W41_03100 [Planctomycetota bacterium]
MMARLHFTLALIAFFAVAPELTVADSMGTTAAVSRAAARPEFRSYGLYLDTHDAGLGAWQVEVVDLAAKSRLVGIEGGEHRAFAQPAFYDPKALQGARIVLAAFAPDDELPRGKTRVATLHLRVDADAPPEFKLRLIAAVDALGNDIDAELEIRQES